MTTWRQRALCADLPPDLFFSEALADVRDAKAVCARCPVRQECLDWATETKQEYGVWGGVLFSEEPDSTIKHGTYTGYVRGCRLATCAPDGGCTGAKARYTAKVAARAARKKAGAR